MPSTNAAIADEPNQNERTNPIETTSARAVLRTSVTVGAMISSSAVRLNTPPVRLMIHRCTAVTVSGPNSSPTNPSVPNMPSSSGGSESVCQNAADADSLKMSSFQALPTVRPSTRRTALRRDAGAAAVAVRPGTAVSALVPVGSVRISGTGTACAVHQPAAVRTPRRRSALWALQSGGWRTWAQASTYWAV